MLHELEYADVHICRTLVVFQNQESSYNARESVRTKHMSVTVGKMSFLQQK